MLQEFMEWWLTHLKALLPVRLQAQLQRKRCLLFLQVERESVHIHATFQGQTYPFGSIAAEREPGVDPALGSFIEQLPRRPERVIVRIAAGRYLGRDVELPLAAEETLAEAIAFQMEQLTPFREDQVVHFSGIRERQPEQKKILAWLIVTPREQVQYALSLLGGIPPELSYQPQQPPGKGNPLDIEYRPVDGRGGLALGGPLPLAVILGLLLLLATSLHMRNLLQSRQYLEEQLTGYRADAAQVTRLRSELQSLSDQAGLLHELQLARPRVLALWNDLSQRLTADTWVQRIDLRDGRLFVQGSSANAAQLIEQLEASPYLRDVRFASSVTRDQQTGKDRFNVSAILASYGGDPS